MSLSILARFSKVAAALTIAALVLLNAPLSAYAQDPLDAPRASGQVGERFDGFAQVRDGGGDLNQLVDRINGERRKVYEDLAAKEGTNAEAVGRVFARRLLDKAPAGTWFLDENGNWRQK